MHRSTQPAVILVLAILLATGPGWCRMHCAVANNFRSVTVATCCHADSANTLQHRSSPANAECRCQAQPITNDTRGLVVEQPTAVFLCDLITSRTVAALPGRILNEATLDGRIDVPIHVLKCVWRC